MKKISLGLFLAWIIASCSAPQGTEQSVRISKELSESEKIQFDKKFFDAQKEKALGNWEKVVRHLEVCQSIDETNDAVYYELSIAYLELGDIHAGILYGQKAAELDPANKWYHLHLISIYEATQQYDLQAEQYELLLKYDADNTLYMYDLAIVYMQLNELEKALDMYDQMEERTGVNEEISMQKKLIYLRLNKLDKAVDEMEKLIEWKPRRILYYLSLAELYAINGQEDKAREVYERAMAIDPDNGYIQLALGKDKFEKGDYSSAFEHYTIAFADPDIGIDEKIMVLLKVFDLTEKQAELRPQVAPVMEALEKAHSDDPKTYAMKGDYLLRDEKKFEAREAFRTAIELGGDLFPIWSEVLILDLELEDYESLAREGDQAIELFPSQASNYIMSAFGYFQLENYSACVDRCEEGLLYAAANRFLQIQFYSTMGDAYHQMEEHEKSDSSYDACLKLDPENSTVLNNYAYYLSLRKEKLEKAKEMSEKSLELSPDNDTFEDTYAWILFQMEDYENALIWIEKALAHGSAGSGTVVEHYGDILFKLGRTDDAIVQWEKAKELGGGSDTLEEKLINKGL
jgi:tetratricopeptide (TPR) repeat protein